MINERNKNEIQNNFLFNPSEKRDSIDSDSSALMRATNEKPMPVENVEIERNSANNSGLNARDASQMLVAPENGGSKSSDRESEIEILSQRQTVVKIVRRYLIKKYNITITEDEVRDFIKDEIEGVLSEEQIEKQKEFQERQIAAVEAILDGSSAKEAADLYLEEWSDVPEMLKSLESLAAKDKLDELKNMLPENLSDAIEKSIPGHRDILIDYKISQILFDDKNISNKSYEWRFMYENKLIDIAQKELIDKEPELQSIDFDRIKNP